jgi:TolB-like protein/DNA-binding winged helix-turn-helix (wHTH) protein/predicted Zn-dependent protease
MRPTWAKADFDTSSCLETGDLTLWPSQRRLFRNGTEISLGKLSYDLLLLLVESAPNLVSIEEITAKLWSDRVVTEDTVRQRIKLLRKALSDDPSNPRYLHVVRGQGYRFIPDVRHSRAGRQHNFFKLTRAMNWPAGAMVLAGAVLLVWAISSRSPAVNIPADNSIAVLPFEALTVEPGDEFFVDGFHNDLLTHLARIDELSVISRTSVIEYRDNVKNLRQIGEELGVTNILEGSVQRSGTRIRINAQLIDARTDRHLWAEAYDREVTVENIFKIQSEMANAISLALQIELSPYETASFQQSPTGNTSAYNHYLLGVHHTNGTEGIKSFREAAAAFQRAVFEDPEYAVAWAALARAHSALYFFDGHADTHRQKSREALDKAFLLQPDLPEAYLARGYFLYHTQRDYAAALSALDAAERGMPGDIRINEARAIIYGRSGDSDRAIEQLSKSIALDPRNVGELLNLAHHYTRTELFDEALAIYDRVVRLEPDNPVGYRRRAFLTLWRDGDVRTMRSTLASAPMDVRIYSLEWLAMIYERDFAAAIDLLDSWQINVVSSPREYRPKSWFYGITHALAENNDAAVEWFDAARIEIEELARRRPADLRLNITLADILAHLGERERSVGLAKEVLRKIPIELDAGLGPSFRLNAIKAFLAAGAYDSAIIELQEYLSEPSVWTIDGLLPDPRLDPIRNDPRFVDLVDQYGKTEFRVAQRRHLP